MKIMSRTSIIVTFIIVLCCISLPCYLAYGEDSWTFVVIGDTRGERETITGVSEYLPEIAAKIASLDPSLVLVSGDLINGDALSDTPDVNNPRIPYATQFENWKAAMESVYNAGITIYPVRGNHENYASDIDPPIPSLKQAYYDAFGLTVPQNGPNNGLDDNQLGYSWDLKLKNVRIVTVDQYFYFHETPLGGRNYYEIDQAWVDAQLRKTAPRRYTFVMAHEPAFSLDHEEGAFFGSSAEGIANRKAFWDSLGANSVKMYLTAHVHNLQVGTAVDDSGNVIYQNMTGNGGAELGPDDGGQDSLLTPTYSNYTDYGFSLYTVTDDKITITYYLYNPISPTPWTVASYTIALYANPVYTWDVPSGIFSDASSWDPHIVPGTADTAVFDSGAGTSSIANFIEDAHNRRLFVASGSVLFNLADNTYTADSVAIDGSEDITYSPSLTISGDGSHFNTTKLTMDGISSFIVEQGASATCDTITIEGGNATLGGQISATNLNLTAGTLDVGTSNLSVAATGVGGYAQATGTALKLTANSTLDFGKITSSAAAVISAASAVNVNVGGYIPNNATLTILNTTGLGIGDVPGTITSSNQYVTFSGSDLDGNLVLTADRSATGFEHAATNSNSAAVGAVLDNITNPSADMTTILDTLGNLSPSDVASAENTMSPTADRGVIDTTNAAKDQFVGATVLRLQDSKVEEDRNDIWAHAYGDYAHQDSRGLSNGYLARVWGDVIGIDRSFRDNSLRLGLAQGFGWGQVLSKDNSGHTEITSYQTGLYGEYEGKIHPYILDAVLTYGYNDYDSSRSVAVGSINRTASSDYSGQQFSSYLEGGYKFKNKNFDTTPLLAINYTHLHIAGYTETGADSLNLSVDAQNYDTLQLGTGLRLSRAFETENLLFTPELHFRYFYDMINDTQQTLAAFMGAGTSFQTTGFRPAPSSFELGARLEFFNKKNLTLLADLDTVLKDDYYEAGGSLTLKYSF